MNRTNKLISFVCSLAMISTTFAGMITANAEDTTPETSTEITNGIELQYDEEASTSRSIVIDVYAKGVPFVDGFQVSFDIPEGLEFDAPDNLNSLCVTESPMSISVIYSETADMYTVSGYASSSLHDTASNPLLATITIPFTSDIQNDIVLTLTGNSALTGYENADFTGTYQELSLIAGNMPASSVTVSAKPASTEIATDDPASTETATTEPAPTVSAEPEATPYPVERPTMRPVPTDEPTSTPAPTPIVVEQGIELQYDEEASTSRSIVIDVIAKGVPYVDGFQASFIIPEGMEFDAPDNLNGLCTTESPMSVSVIYSDTARMFTVSGYASSSLHDTSANPLLATITIPFTSDLQNDTILTLTGNSALTGYENADFTGTYQELSLIAGNMPATFVVALANPNPEQTESPEPTESPAPFEGGQIALDDLVTKAPASDETYGILVALDVKVTKNNGDEAVYGDDFVAVYDDKELTEDEYFNLINGYGGVSIADVISGLSFVVKDGTSVYAAPAYQPEDDTTGNMTVLPEYGGEQTYAPQSSEEPEDGMVTLTVDTPSHGAITVTYTDADGNSVSLDTDDEDIEEEIPVGTSVKLRAIADNGYDFSRWGGDISGTSSPKTITVNRDTDVSATFTRTGSNSSSGGSSSSGSTGNGNSAGGGIARPNGGTGVVTPGINFTDLGSVQWAQPAINYLVSAGIINGRSNTIFDPNASVTRAEFAKMVCATFGISATPNAAQTFVDVSPSDWFYGYVQAAAANGIVNGVSETAFDPNATITREQMAAMLYRAIEATGNLAKLPAGTATVFADEAQIADYAKTYVSALNAAGVINGTSATTFEPKATATRAQAAAIIYQYLGAVGLV